MKAITINLYLFSELSENAKQTAIQDHRNFELNIMQLSDFLSGDPEFDTPEKLKEAYNAEFEYRLENDEPIIESIEENGYLFFSDGKMANCTTYCGKHEKAGITEIKIGTEIYRVN